MKAFGEMVESESLFVAKFWLPGVPGKKTAHCFTGSEYEIRERAIDRDFAEYQPETPQRSLTVRTFAYATPPCEWAASILGVSEEKIDIHDLELFLQGGNCLLTLPQIEMIVTLTDAGVYTGVRLDGWGNFAFVQGKDDEVMVVHFHSLNHELWGSHGLWGVRVNPFDWRSPWPAGSHVFYLD
ncbi:MAG: hypothetical protein ACYCZZ_03610 [Minisyncoccota bacterium]